MNENYPKYNSAQKLEKQIGCAKYILFCLNIVSWMFGLALFGVTVWIRAEPGFDDWLTKMEITAYFIGIYVLIITSIITLTTSFLGCVSALMENIFAISIFVATQILNFLLVTVGSAVLMDYGTLNSSIQPIIRNTIHRLIMTSDYHVSSNILRTVQENIGCCGADGANDYMLLRQPLPAECRDSVTGNAFFHGCVDELSWFIEDKTAWVAGIAMTIGLMNVFCGVLGIVLIQAIKKEEEEARNFRR